MRRHLGSLTASDENGDSNETPIARREAGAFPQFGDIAPCAFFSSAGETTRTSFLPRDASVSLRISRHSILLRELPFPSIPRSCRRAQLWPRNVPTCACFAAPSIVLLVRRNPPTSPIGISAAASPRGIRTVPDVTTGSDRARVGVPRRVRAGFKRHRAGRRMRCLPGFSDRPHRARNSTREGLGERSARPIPPRAADRDLLVPRREKTRAGKASKPPVRRWIGPLLNSFGFNGPNSLQPCERLIRRFGSLGLMREP